MFVDFHIEWSGGNGINELTCNLKSNKKPKWG